MKSSLILFAIFAVLFLSPASRCRAGEPTSPLTSDVSVAGSAEDVCPLAIGKTVPSLVLNKPDGSAVELKSLLAEKPTILIFYRGGWCPYCNTHMGQLQQAEASLQALGYQIVGVSPDKPEKLKESIQKHSLGYQLLSDSKMLAARAFGIAFQVDSATYTKLSLFGINLENASGETHHWLPVPGVFILSKSGEIKFSHVNPNYKVRLDPDVLLAAAKAALR